MYKLAVFIPESHLEEVKTAMFEAGAGKIGNYQHCCWQVKGQGQFMAVDGANPFIGAIDSLEAVNEYKVELVCKGDRIREVISAMKQAHPYEEPAYDVIKLEDL